MMMSNAEVKHTARRELDKAIAEKLFGLKVFRPCDVKTVQEDYFQGEDYHYIPSRKPPRTHMIDARPVPRFSENIAAAWQVVEKLKQMGCEVLISTDGKGFEAEITVSEALFNDGYQSSFANEESAPLAICRAALVTFAKAEGKR